MGPAAVTDLLAARSAQWTKFGISAEPFASARDLLVLGAYKPSAATTGVLPGIPRTTVTSAAALPGGGLIPGTVYQNYNFQFVVDPPTGTSPIIFRNCLFQGSAAAPTSDVGLAKLYDAGHAPCEFWDCTFAAMTPSRWWNGIHGANFKAYRCDISQCIDPFNIFRSDDPTGPLNVEIYQSYVHDMHWFANPPETRAVDGSHPDGVQLQSGSGFTLWGNNIQAYNHPDFFNTYYGTAHANAVMLIKPDVGVITTVDIQFNWFDGGAAGLNITHDNPRFLADIGIIKNNLFGRGMRNGAGWAINRQTSAITWDGGSGTTANRYEDDLTPVPIRTG